MKAFTIALFLSTLFSISLAQEDPRRTKIYNARVLIMDVPRQSVNGTLFEIKDSSLVLSSVVQRNISSIGSSYLNEVHFSVMEAVKIKRKNSTWRGLGFGALAGLTVGAIAGFASGSDPKEDWFAFTAAEKALIGVILGAPLGGAVGAVVGSTVKVSIPINGNFDLFRQKKPILQQYSLMKEKNLP